jgi:hypothetical protein
MAKQQNQARTLEQLRDKVKTDPHNSDRAVWDEQIHDLKQKLMKTQSRNTSRKTLTSSMRSLPGNTPSPSGIGHIQSPHEKMIADKISGLGSMEEIRANYLKTALYPETHADRMPDESTLPTVIYRSVRELSIVANMDGTANAGRFSIAALPVLGNKNIVPEYQLGVVNNNSGWPTDFRQAGSYLADTDGDDPRVDPYLELLTNTSSGLFELENTLPLTLDPSTYEGGVMNPTSIPYNSLDAVVKLVGGYNFTVGGLTGFVNNARSISLPPSTYNVNYNLTSQITSTTGTNGMIFLCIERDENGTAIGAFRTGYGVSFATYGTMDANRLFARFSLLSIGSEVMGSVSINFEAKSKRDYIFAVQTLQPMTASTADSDIVLIPVLDDDLNTVSDSGVIIKMRPIAQSALFTCTLPDINAGGNIVGYSAPAGDIQNYYYDTSNTVGPYQNWEVLARNNKGICTHDGMLKQGTYVFSQPWDKNDVLMRTPTDSLSYPYQGIIISGQVNPSVGLTGLIEIGRLRVVTVFEYTTDARIFTPMTCIGSTNDLDYVLAYLSQCQHAMENPIHFKQLGDYMKKGIKFIGDNIPTMIKGLTLASQFI